MSMPKPRMKTRDEVCHKRGRWLKIQGSRDGTGRLKHAQTNALKIAQLYQLGRIAQRLSRGMSNIPLACDGVLAVSFTSVDGLLKILHAFLFVHTSVSIFSRAYLLTACSVTIWRASLSTKGTRDCLVKLI